MIDPSTLDGFSPAEELLSMAGFWARETPAFYTHVREVWWVEPPFLRQGRQGCRVNKHKLIRVKYLPGLWSGTLCRLRAWHWRRLGNTASLVQDSWIPWGRWRTPKNGQNVLYYGINTRRPEMLQNPSRSSECANGVNVLFKTKHARE